MSRVQVVRGVIPPIAKNAWNLEMVTASGPATGTFDPSFTTSFSTTMTIDYGDGVVETSAPGTSHAFSHTYAVLGTWRAVVRCAAGLGAITGIDISDDLITSIKNLLKCTKLVTFAPFKNANLNYPINLIPKSVTYILGGYHNNTVMGSLQDLPPLAISIQLQVCAGVFGTFANLLAASQTVYLYSGPAIPAASIAHLVAIRDLRIYSMGWSSANVDTVLLSASDAVWANEDNFSYTAPSLQIGGTNPAPGGSSGADTTDPMTTPGSGNSNTDWQWDAGKSAHKALTGKAAVYYLTHLATHQWAITYT